ncbi:AsmA family protein [Escherichia coli]
MTRNYAVAVTRWRHSLGNSNGNLKLLMNDGLVSRNLMEIVGLNVGNYIVGAIFGDDEVRVNCAAANLNIANGVARPQIFLLSILRTR